MQRLAIGLARLAKLGELEPVRQLATLFDGAGFEFALVGGPVRDAFLERESPDLDFTTNATPDEMTRLLRGKVDALFDVGRAFGTIGVRLGSAQIEITTYRTEQYQEDSRNPEVRFGTDLDDDLVRRDFTVNAMAYRLPAGVFVDPFGGLSDLVEGRITTPTDPAKSFGDDPLRMLRAARFSSQLGFLVADETFAAMRDLRDRIEIISRERIRDELSKLLLGADPVAGLELLVDSGLAELVLPELPALRLEVDEHHHHKDVYEHSLTVLRQAIEYEERYGLEGDLVLRLAALLHDIGKPATRRLEPGGAVSFYHHDMVGAKLASKRLKALRFDNHTIDAVNLLIALHLRFFGYGEANWSDSAVRRYVRDAGEQLQRLHVLTRSDVTTRNRRKADHLSHAYDDLERRIAELSAREELDALRPELDGEEIMRILELRPGKEVGEAYRFLLEQRIENGPIGVEATEKLLREWWAAR